MKGIQEYMAEFTKESTFGPDGYLADRGMIPSDDLRKQFGNAKNLVTLKSSTFKCDVSLMRQTALLFTHVE